MKGLIVVLPSVTGGNGRQWTRNGSVFVVLYIIFCISAETAIIYLGGAPPSPLCAKAYAAAAAAGRPQSHAMPVMLVTQ